MSLADSCKKTKSVTPKLTEMGKLFNPANHGFEDSDTFSKLRTDNAASFTSLHSDDYYLQPKLASHSFYANLPLMNDLNEIDESYLNIKGFSSYLNNSNMISLPLLNLSKSSVSSIKVYNHFTTAYEDFG